MLKLREYLKKTILTFIRRGTIRKKTDIVNQQPRREASGYYPLRTNKSGACRHHRLKNFVRDNFFDIKVDSQLSREFTAGNIKPGIIFYQHFSADRLGFIFNIFT